MANDRVGNGGGGGVLGFAAALVGLALVGAGAGFGFVTLTGIALQDRKGGATEAAPPGHVAGDTGRQPGTATPGTAADHAGQEMLMALEPIVVSLAKPGGGNLRLEALVVFSKAPNDDQSRLLKIMQDDLTNFLRTVSLTQIETAAGLEFLREDLSELIQIRSKGSARGIVLKGLAIE